MPGGSDAGSGLADRTAIVTGGSEGIGFSIAEALVAAGARVVLTGRRVDALADAANRLGTHVTTVAGDIAEADSANRAVERAIEFGGGLDLLVCNAGVLLPGSVVQQPPDDVLRIVDTNLVGTIGSVRAAAPVLAEGKDPAIVVITSSIGRRATPGLGVYGATKAALHYLVPTWAAELSHWNIRVNGVCAGITLTPGFLDVEATVPGLRDAVTSTNLAGRMATPEEIARPVLTLLDGSVSPFVTGSVWDVDGGHDLAPRGGAR